MTSRLLLAFMLAVGLMLWLLFKAMQRFEENRLPNIPLLDIASIFFGALGWTCILMAFYFLCKI